MPKFLQTTTALILACASASPATRPADVEMGPTPGDVDYAKAAAAYPFALSADQLRQYDVEFGPFYSIGQSVPDTYQTELIIPPGHRTIQYRISREGHTLYEWAGHRWTTFRIAGDDLFYVLNNPSGSGGAAVAVDLRTGAIRWRKPLLGLGPIAYSAYFARAKVSVNTDAVTVEGDESGGRFVEYLDRRTGLRLGHATSGGAARAR